MCIVCNCEKNKIDITKVFKLRTLDISGCHFVKSIGVIDGVEEINCRNCVNLENLFLEESKNLRNLDCRGCVRLKSIPKINGLINLYCEHCYDLESIGESDSLKLIWCRKCPKLKSIPNFKLDILSCENCWMLVKIPDCRSVIKYGCPWLDDKNIQKIIKLQRWVRNVRKSKYLGSDEFKRFFYAPTGFGGYKSKLRSLRILNN